MTTDNTMQTISRAISILKSFSRDDRELSLADFHHRLGLSKSSLQRILSTLVSQGFLEKDNEKKTYKLGIELYYLGNLVEEHSHLLRIVKPYLILVRDKTNENVYLNIIENDLRKCIALEEAKHDLMTISYVGQTSPLYAGASAKLLLAYLTADEIQLYLENMEKEKITNVTKTERDELVEEIRFINQNGYAISYGERVPGVCSVSVPLYNRWNKVIASLSISAPLSRVDDDIVSNFIQILRETSKSINEELRFVSQD
ncbi:IclR family transcriptional regulator [Psychrobacillus sp. OK032]|uniref:IclR family transcriptional regulator n=1 Tax=Psychrobacillus sp. OK032 TaxID=1884358 RepID=UPI0008D3B599|nr:IclR family transcriptional regulator [Psychrobacillus sp. OK032]SER69756.1 transcriptional regulator, IclR family [Psychrobacillus sp. OK032]